MRELWKALFLKGYIVPAFTFENVNGDFPIGFHIWDFAQNENFPAEMSFDVYDEKGVLYFKSPKTFSSKNDPIVNWLRNYFDKTSSTIGSIRIKGSDFQNNQYISISVSPTKNDEIQHTFTWVTKKNLCEMAIYFTVRHIIAHTWLNHDDQFYAPYDEYKADIEFQNNCLVYTLFHGKNTIQSHYGVNHWIPFTEKEVGAREKFESNFMSGFLKGCTLSAEAAAVLDAGRELWKYYHAAIKNSKTASVNASYYDIREYFQGRKVSGNMNTKSTDETYNALLAALRGALKTLTGKIQPKVYEYGFLKE